MKFKLTVLALLMVGFVVGASSPAFAKVVISKNAATMVSANVETPATGIPAAILTYTNDGAGSVTVDKISLQMGSAGYDAVTDFKYSVWLDKDKNGVVSWGDTQIKAAADVPAVSATVLVDLDPNVAITGSGGTMVVIVAIDITGASAAEYVTIGADTTPSNNVATTTIIWENSTTAPPVASNMAVVTVKASASETLTMAAASPAVKATRIPNRARSAALLNFKLTNSTTFGQVLNAIQFDAAGDSSDLSVGDEADAIEVVMIYIDKGTIGTMDTADIRVMAVDDSMEANTDQFMLKPGIYVAPDGVLNMLIGMSLSGANPTDDVVALDTDIGNFSVNGGDVAAGTNVKASGDTLNALSVYDGEYYGGTADLMGPPHGRANGIIDAVKLTFKVGKTATAINDASLAAAVTDGQVSVNGSTDSGWISFSSIYGGDAVNNSYAYLKLNEDYDDYSTSWEPSIEYTGTVDPNKRIISLDGQYGLPNFSGDAADKAPPAPLAVETIDTEGNGKIDNIRFIFGDEDVYVDTYDLDEALGFTISGYDIDGGDIYSNNVIVYVDEEGYDTGNKPPYAYSNATGFLRDDAGNKVLSFNQNDIPVVDKARPKLWHVKTLDQDLDGMFDALQLDFSEAVALNSGYTAASITMNNIEPGYFDTDGFYFGWDHGDTYDFTKTGTTGVGTNQLIVKVNEVGSFDTGVMPGLMYLGTDTEHSPLVDKAATPNALMGIGWYEYEGDPYYYNDLLEFVMVASDDDVEEFEDVWLEDGISPKVTGAAWLDDDGDGKLDTVAMMFSEPMGSDAASYETLAIVGHDVESAVVEGTFVYVEVDETGYDTGMTPDITYSDDEIVDANGAELLALTTDSVVELDNAYPVIYEAKTADLGYGSVDGSGVYNGRIDGMILKFSEPMNTAKLDKKGSPAGDQLKEEITLSSYAVNDTVKFTDSQTAIVYLSEILTGYDTDQVPDLMYTAVGDSNLADMVGLALNNIAAGSALKETDGAPPVPVAAKTLDILRWDLGRDPIRMYNDHGDGYIDGVIITFSEELGEDVDTELVAAAVSLSEENNAIELDMSGMTIDDRTSPTIANVVVDTFTVQIIGYNEMAADSWDTGEKPDVDIAADNGIMDVEGNVVAVIEEYPTTDGAAPILAKALAQIDSKYIEIWFSEPVTNDLGEAIDEDDLEYGGEVAENTFVGIEGEDDNYILETEDVVILAAAVSDWISVVEDAVIDSVGLIVPVGEVGMLDTTTPTLTDAITQDVDGNGMVDHIKLTYSEPIKDENINGNPVFAGQVLPDLMFARDSKLLDAITVTGFNVIGINLCGDTFLDEDDDEVDGDDLAADVTAYLRGQKVLTTKQSVINVKDVPNDNVLWLMVTAAEAPPEDLGNTDAAPKLTMTAGPGNTGIGDFRPNYAEAVTNYSVPDRCGPGILKAEMPSTQILRVWMSEVLRTPLASAGGVASVDDDGVFAWLVGTEKAHYENYIVNWTKVSGTTAQYEIVLFDVSVPYNSIGTINFQAADRVFGDGSGNRYARNPDKYNGNVVAFKNVNVLPPKFDTAVEEEADVPGVFSISKNFPNPFNPSTTINYDIADAGGYVSLVIYNMTGQKVRTLVNEVKAPGYYSIMWDGADDLGATVSSGIYLYKIVCGDFSKIEKMTFVK